MIFPLKDIKMSHFKPRQKNLNCIILKKNHWLELVHHSQSKFNSESKVYRKQCFLFFEFEVPSNWPYWITENKTMNKISNSNKTCVGHFVTFQKCALNLSVDLTDSKIKNPTLKLLHDESKGSRNGTMRT